MTKLRTGPCPSLHALRKDLRRQLRSAEAAYARMASLKSSGMGDRHAAADRKIYLTRAAHLREQIDLHAASACPHCRRPAATGPLFGGPALKVEAATCASCGHSERQHNPKTGTCRTCEWSSKVIALGEPCQRFRPASTPGEADAARKAARAAPHDELPPSWPTQSRKEAQEIARRLTRA